jgi:hypothetical protein
MSSALQVHDAIEASCTKNHTKVQIFSPADEDTVNGEMTRGTKKGLRRATFDIEDGTLRLSAVIKKRAYNQLHVSAERGRMQVWEGASGSLDKPSPFAAQDLKRLERQLEVLSKQDFTLQVAEEGLYLTVDLRKDGTARLLVEHIFDLVIAIWRHLAPVGEGTGRRVKRRKKRRDKKPAPKTHQRYEGEPAATAITRLVDTVKDACKRHRAVVERVGDAVEARLEDRFGQKTRIVIGFATTHQQISRLEVRAFVGVPPFPGKLVLKGPVFSLWSRLWKWIKRESLGDPELDARFSIADESGKRPDLKPHRGPLMRLGDLKADLRFSGPRLIVHIGHLGALDKKRDLMAALASILELWERWSHHHRGFES